MRQVLLFATICLGLLVASILALPFIVSTQNIKIQMDKRVLELTGSHISYTGDPKLSFNPFLGIELNDVVLEGSKLSPEEPELLRVENLRFKLKVLPLLFGKIRLSDFRLIRPSIKLLWRADGSANWQVRFNSKSGDASSYKDIKPGQFEIIDGIVEARWPGEKTPLRVSNLNSVVNWPDISSAWEVTGQGVWRGELLEINNTVENPIAFFSSGKSDLQLSIKSPALNASFTGHATMVSDIQIEGKASIFTPSLRRLSTLMLNEDSVTDLPTGRFLLEGNVFANAREIRFDDTELKLEPNVATGNLQLYWNDKKKPKVTGTLAFSALDFAPFLEAVSKNMAGPVDPDAKPKSRFPLDVDLRFSASNFKIRDSDFSALAATIIVSNNEWSFDIGEADFFDGMVVATISSKVAETGREIKLKGILRDVSMGDVLRDWHGGTILATGKTNVNFDLTMPGEKPINSIRQFYGEMEIAVAEGQIEGFDLVKVIAALDKTNGFVGADEINGATPFDSLALDFVIYNGVGWITKGEAKSTEKEISLTGKIDLLHGGLAINADIVPTTPADNPDPRTSILIGGTVQIPLVTHALTGRN